MCTARSFWLEVMGRVLQLLSIILESRNNILLTRLLLFDLIVRNPKPLLSEAKRKVKFCHIVSEKRKCWQESYPLGKSGKGVIGVLVSLILRK